MKPIAAAIISLISALAAATASAAQPATRPMIELRSGDLLLEAAPLGRSPSNFDLLGRDGRIWSIKANTVKSWRKLPMDFRSLTATEIRQALVKELDGRLDVSGTGHYVVACPHGQGKLWNDRFEELFRSFKQYFAARGLDPAEPQFPLVAIVWPSQGDFQLYARKDGAELGANVLGYYSVQTNRITLYDTVGSGGNWERNASVIIHEATHQSAFNCGLHNRFCPPPRWQAEGLGMLFEARGVWDSRRYLAFAERVNRGRLNQFRESLTTGRTPQFWLSLVNSDKSFDKDPLASYAESWAFSFFLMETMPGKYRSYLKRTASRADFVPVTKADRLADFKAEFGVDFGMLEANFLRFIAAIH